METKSMTNNNIWQARLISVIEVMAKHGTGTTEDPVRIVTQYWDTDGNFLAEKDTSEEEKNN